MYEPFAQRAVTALGELRLVAIEDRIDAELSLGEHRELVAEIERLVEEYPFRERLRGLLMLALYRAGRQADALAAYRRARHALLEELGVEPGPELKSLHQAILRHDTALGPRPREITAQRWLPLERRTVTVVYTDLRPMAEPGTDPEAVNRYGAQVLDAATEVFDVTAGGWCRSSATRSWPSSVSRWLTRMTRFGRYARPSNCALPQKPLAGLANSRSLPSLASKPG